MLEATSSAPLWRDPSVKWIRILTKRLSSAMGLLSHLHGRAQWGPLRPQSLEQHLSSRKCRHQTSSKSQRVRKRWKAHVPTAASLLFTTFYWFGAVFQLILVKEAWMSVGPPAVYGPFRNVLNQDKTETRHSGHRGKCSKIRARCHLRSTFNGHICWIDWLDCCHATEISTDSPIVPWEWSNMIKKPQKSHWAKLLIVWLTAKFAQAHHQAWSLWSSR